MNPRLSELLKNPLFLNIYLENHNTANDINTQGEILDYYVENYKINTTFDKVIIQFLIKFALPFAAKSMSVEYDLMTINIFYEIDRGTVSKAIDEAFDFYIETEMVYQNFTVPNGIRKNTLLECREKYDFVEILIKNTCFLKESEIEPHKLHFTHQYFRDYFMAKYFLNLISTIEIVYNSHIDEKEKMFKKYDLGSVWLNDNDFEVYRLIGEICGDYKNIYSDDFVYTETILDKLIEMSRQFYTFRTMENVINTMNAVRGDVICGVDFSGTSLPVSIPRNLKFSMNGDEPCRFNGCSVALLDILYDYDGNREANWYDDLIDERLTPEILAELGNFRNCDFTDANFLNEDYVDLLKSMGAITDVKKC